MFKKQKLYEMKVGQSAKIFRLPSARNKRIRLEELGVRINSEIKLKKIMPLKGPLVIVRGTTEIALGRDMADEIIVVSEVFGKEDKK